MNVLAKADRAVHAVVRWLVIVLMVAMTAIVFLQVVFRYVFDAPLDWSEEVARFLFVWVSFLGAVSLTRLHQHIDVTLFREMMPRPLKLVALLTGYVLALVCVYFFLIGGLAMTEREWIQLSPAVQIPMGWVYLVIPIAAALMAVCIVCDIVVTLIDAMQEQPS